jgi:hypothetical protein
MRVLVAALVAVLCVPAATQSRVDPRITSIHPFCGQPGTTFVATARGAGLAGAAAVSTENAPFSVTVESIASEPPPENSRNKTPVDLVTLRVQVPQDAQPGHYPVRLLTRNGISNALPLIIVDLPVAGEPPGSHVTAETAVAVASVPAAFAGRLALRGEADHYVFSASAGETLTFEVISGLPQIASAGSAATVANFDPALTIFEAGESWFDAGRLKRIAHNDEPVWVFGRPTDAHLIHRFGKSGRYFLRIEAFAGQGGPDYSYQLRILPGAVPYSAPARKSEWEERAWTRRLDASRLNQLATRGGKPAGLTAIETYRGSSEGPSFKLPATVEGTLGTPGESHRSRFRVEEPADIVMEVETPVASPPFFNPVVRLLNASGTEVATNVFAGRGACSGAMTKSLQAKTLVPLRDPGEYTVEVRDATADNGGPDFQYRLQVRPQVPHVGQVRIDADHLNFIPGEAKTIRIFFDREEDYRGAVMIAPESLPAGLSASVGADYEPDKDDPPTVGKRERYTPRTERAVLVLTAASDAQASPDVHPVRILVRPLVDGKLGDILAAKTIYVMVIEKP